MARKNIDELFQKWMKDPEYKKGYDALEEEFEAVRQAIEACLADQS